MDDTDRWAFARAEEHQRFMDQMPESEDGNTKTMRQLLRERGTMPGQGQDPFRQTQLDRIEAKLDRLLDVLEDVDEVRETKVVRADSEEEDAGLLRKLFK